jgi:hypothetical protein
MKVVTLMCLVLVASAQAPSTPCVSSPASVRFDMVINGHFWQSATAMERRLFVEGFYAGKAQSVPAGETVLAVSAVNLLLRRPFPHKLPSSGSD